MKNILVTGGIGYLGSHTCAELLAKNFNITIIDSLINSDIESLKGIIKIVERKLPDVRKKVEFIKGDIRDESFLEELFLSKKESKNNFDGVIHFCGLKSVNESEHKPFEYWDVNVLGTINLINKIRKYGCDTLVFSSSATVYGFPEKIPITENAKIDPFNTYGRTKAVIENILFDLQKEKSQKFKIAILRYFNPAGAHESGLIGELPLGEPNNIFPLLNRAATIGKEPFEIFGDDWPTEDGTCVRDYIHVSDLAEGHILALEFLFSNKAQIICLNLGTGKGTSVLELVKIFQKVNNVKFPIKLSERREGDVAIAIADNLKAKKILKWDPKKSIEDMCKDGFNWQKVINNKK